MTLAVSRDEPPTTTIYTGHVDRFQATNLCGFIQLDEGGRVFCGRAAAPEGLRKGDRVELRVVPDVYESRKTGVRQFKAWDVRILERGKMGRRLDERKAEMSLAGAQDGSAEAVSGKRTAGVIKTVKRFRSFGSDELKTCGSILPDDGSPEIRYQTWGVAGEELSEGQHVTYISKRDKDHTGPIALNVEPLWEPPPAPVAPPADSATVPAREAPIEEAPVPTLLRLDADFCLELARELLRSEL